MVWYRPKTLEEALTILDTDKPKIVCGGTDLFVNWPDRQGESTTKNWLDIQNLPELKKIEKTTNGLEIGAAVTAAEIWENDDLNLPALKQAARVVGGWQIQNRASLGGNVANASPAADMVVPLVAYEAEVNLKSISGSRTIPVVDFIDGVKSTQIKENELITSITIPTESIGIRQVFLRHDQRGGTDISLVSVAALIKGTRENIAFLKIAVGAANFKPVVLSNLSEIVKGTLTTEQVDELAELYAKNCNPITDIRASAEYRRAMVKVFIKKAISAINN
jgi:CO/xanthine dehydrogenase FAD-binding subunit